jgi:hypothetical protein
MMQLSQIPFRVRATKTMLVHPSLVLVVIDTPSCCCFALCGCDCVADDWKLVLCHGLDQTEICALDHQFAQCRRLQVCQIPLLHDLIW